MEYIEIAKVVYEFAKWAMTPNREEDESERLSRILENNADEIVSRIAFELNDIVDMANLKQDLRNEVRIAIADGLVKLNSGGTDNILRSIEHFDHAINNLKDELRVIGQPYFVQAASLKIVAFEKLGESWKAKNTAAEAADHLRALSPENGASLDSRFREISRRYTRNGMRVEEFNFTLDGNEQMSWTESIDEMRQRKKKKQFDLRRAYRLPYHRSICLWDLYARSFEIWTTRAIKGQNGLFLKVSDDHDDIDPVESDGTTENCRLKLYRKDNEVVILCNNGRFLSAETPTKVNATSLRATSRCKFDFTRLENHKFTLKSIALGRYLGVQLAANRQDWLFYCMESDPTEVAQFTWIDQ